MPKVEFQSDYKDSLDTSFRVWEKSVSDSNLYFRYFYSYFMTAGITGVSAYVFSSNNLQLAFITFAAVLVSCVYFFRIPKQKDFADQCLKIHGAEKFKVEVELTDEGIVTKQEGNLYLFGWENVSEIIETNEKIYFFTKQSGGFAVPLNAFVSNIEEANFVAFAKARIPSKLLEK